MGTGFDGKDFEALIAVSANCVSPLLGGCSVRVGFRVEVLGGGMLEEKA